MKKLCLILLLLNAMFAAQDLEDSVHTPKLILKNVFITTQQTQPDYGIYEEIRRKYLKIYCTFKKECTKSFYNISNPDFPWDEISKIQKIHFEYFFINEIDQGFVHILNQLSAISAAENQQKISDFLAYFRSYKKRPYTRNIDELLDILRKFDVINNFILKNIWP